MYCPKCGTQNDDNAFKCVKCGIIVQRTAMPVSPKKSNTAVVVLVVAGIAIGLVMLIGILAAIAIPTFLGYKTKASNAMAQAELKNACNAAAGIIAENPAKTITIDDLKAKGVGIKPEMELAIDDGTMENLSMHVRHSKGNKVYGADKFCNITERQFE